MARKKNGYNNEHPCLFDQFEVSTPGKDLPIFPDIASHAKKMQEESEDPKDTSALEIPIENLAPIKKTLFISFGSGSSGNCAYLGDYNSGILIDAGVDIKNVLDSLKENHIPVEAVKGICLTHDHGDHIRYAYAFLRKFRNMALYCTPKTLNGILRRHNVSRRIKDYHKPIYKEIQFKISNLELTAFEVSHDGTDNMGYFIEINGLKFAIATDLGCITERVRYYASQANIIMLESNYDLRMLVNGTYAEQLKARILKDTGHLDNTAAAQFISEIWNKEITHIFLCHLSNDNNTPEIAVNGMSNILKAKGVTVGDGSESIESRNADVQIVALPRFDNSRLYIFRND